MAVKESDASPVPELPAELVQMLVELSNSLNKHTMYPAGHPMLAGAAENLAAQFARIFENRQALALGVSPTQIIAAGVPSDAGHLVIRELSAKLHRRNIGALKFYQGVDREELVEALLFLATDERTTDASVLRRWAHIRIHPLSYSQLELVGEGRDKGDTSWSTRLWLELSQAALEATTEETPDPAWVARAIDQRQWDEQYGRRIAESLNDLLEACRARGGAEALQLQSQISRMISSMEPETLERLVMMERNEAERKRFLLEIAQSMAVDAVLDLVQAAANATSRSLSPALVQLLGKLADFSQEGAEETRERAEFAFRHQVRELIEGWDEYDREDPAPADHQRTMDNLRLAGKSPLRGQSSTYGCEPDRVLMMSLEVGEANASAGDAASWLIQQGKTAQLRDLFARSPSPGLASEILRGAVTETAFRTLLERDPLDLSGLELMLPLLGDVAMLPLLDALAGAERPERRDQLVRLLLAFPERVGQEAVERLATTEWPEQRNYLTLLTRLPAMPRGFSPGTFIDHPEARVRTEALRILFRGTNTRVRAICEALASKDRATVRMGVFAAVEDCPAAAVPLLIPLVERADYEVGMTTAAIQALAPVPQPLALECLVGQCLIRGRWFRRSRIAGKSPVVLAALTGLARHWSTHARAREPLDLAAAHNDPEVRAAAEQKPR